MNVKHELSLNAIALMLIIDWFRPFKHLMYSLGVLYLTIMNLPHSHRFKKENVLTVGILPGPHEPKQHMNSFLDPLVSELVELQIGVPTTVSSSISTSEFPIRCLLLSVACDRPAARKVCGFLSPAAKHGCSKCFKEFPGKPGQMDCSGFERSLWSKSTIQEHCQNVQLALQANTQKKRSIGKFVWMLLLIFTQAFLL